MSDLTEIVAFITEMSALLGFVISVYVIIRKIIEGLRCQLRSEMLRSYYNNLESKTIRQYELENFVKLYNAYKALKGNSFIDKIYKEVMTWKVIT